MAGRIASLPMYDLPESAAFTDAWWAGLARHFAQAGVASPPARLTRPGEGAAFWLRSDVLFSQACGYPLIGSLCGEVTLLAAPAYDAPGCACADYCSFIIVQAASAWNAFPDLRGRTCAINGRESWSGHHALRLMVAEEVLGGKENFCRTIVSGSHAGSVKAVAEGKADFAAVDCVTHATLARYRPASLEGTRVLARTPHMPGLPLIAGKAASPRDIEAMREGLKAAMGDPALAGARKALGIAGLEFLPLTQYGRLREALESISAAGVTPLL